MDIKGKAILITAASRGLGAALARELSRQEGRVVLVARGADALDDVARGIREDGGEVHAIAADIGRKQAIHTIGGRAAALVGPIDILINNAATLGPTPMPLLLDTACEDLERVLQVNLIGPFRLAKLLIGPMVLRGEGLVFNVSSDAAVVAYPRWGAYGVAKAALEHLGQIWAAELDGTGVKVVNVDPGEMNTRMHAEADPAADPTLLADPTHAARSIVALIHRIESVPGGSRIVLSHDSALSGAASGERT
jgi:NAD(P)-dependent dehydrogenase (short-subunit alcohol dehydrogenase family)